MGGGVKRELDGGMLEGAGWGVGERVSRWPYLRIADVNARCIGTLKGWTREKVVGGIFRRLNYGAGALFVQWALDV